MTSVLAGNPLPPRHDCHMVFSLCFSSLFCPFYLLEVAHPVPVEKVALHRRRPPRVTFGSLYFFGPLGAFGGATDQNNGDHNSHEND